VVISGDKPHRFLIHDHDSIYSADVDRAIAAMGLPIVTTPVRSPQLEEWRRVFLDGGTQSVKKRVDPEDRELKRAQAKLGGVMMRLELAEGLLEKKDRRCPQCGP
jgi:hypothetical protein